MEGKQLVYVYRGKAIKEVTDTDDEMEVPEQGKIVKVDGIAYMVLPGPTWHGGAGGQMSVPPCFSTKSRLPVSTKGVAGDKR
jgi:hypothetical protein